MPREHDQILISAMVRELGDLLGFELQPAVAFHRVEEFAVGFDLVWRGVNGSVLVFHHMGQMCAPYLEYYDAVTYMLHRFAARKDSLPHEGMRTELRSLFGVLCPEPETVPAA